MAARQRGRAKVRSINLSVPSTSSRDAAKWRHRLWSLPSRRQLAQELAGRIGDHGHGIFERVLGRWRGGLHPTDLSNVLARCRFDLGVGCDRVKSSKCGDVSTHGSTVDPWFVCGTGSYGTSVDPSWLVAGWKCRVSCAVPGLNDQGATRNTPAVDRVGDHGWGVRSAPLGIRTRNLRIKSPLLCR